MSAKNNNIRFISGQWKGRTISFPSVDGLRPGTGLMRETLLNWLRFDLDGALILDAFAGSGILGLDALSEGAGHVDAIDISPLAVQSIENTTRHLPQCALSVYQGSFPSKIPKEIQEKKYDYIFLDPPYDSSLLKESLDFLKDGAMLFSYTKIFIHYPSHPFDLDDCWETIKSSKRGHSGFSIISLKDFNG